MIEHIPMTLFMIGAMVSWGAGDFCGGLISKRYSVYSVLLTAQLIGIIPLFALMLLFEKMPQFHDLLFGSLSGLGGMIGLLHLYKGLAQGRMAIVAPLTAMIMCIIPVLVGMIIDGVATGLQMCGFVVALLAIWLVSSDGRRLTVTILELRLAIIAGVTMGSACIAIDQGTGESVLGLTLAARITSISLLLLYVVTQKQWQAPKFEFLPLLATAGLCDVLGNYFFTTAVLAGRLDVATMVSSLYPVVTIALAWLILKERLRIRQWLGIFSALLAIVLIAS